MGAATTDEEDRQIREIIAEWHAHGTEAFERPDGTTWPKHPEFVFRLSGEWKGWVHLLDQPAGAEDRERDRLEDIAFQRLIDALGPPPRA